MVVMTEPASPKLAGFGQSEGGPRTAWGDPDLQGIWNYATMTPLERPRDLAEKAVLTPDEAAAYERQTIERQAAPTTPPAPTGGIPARAPRQPPDVADRRSRRTAGCRR